MSGVLRRLIDTQVYLSHMFDKILPAMYRIDGNSNYRELFVPQYLRNRLIVYDVGGGRHPVISSVLKEQFALTVIGLDIDKHELAHAPHGTYDTTICADITRYRGRSDANLVLCNAVLEHVTNVEEAFAGIVSLLKPEGIAIVFVPSRNAIYARLNRMLPEYLKRYLLYKIFPQTKKKQGFPSYYHRCTPEDFEQIGGKYGLEIDSKRLYFMSAYFSCCFPCYVLWRIWILCFHFFAGEQAAETFAIAFKKRADTYDDNCQRPY